MNVQGFYKDLFERVLGLDVLGLESTLPVLVKLVETRTLDTFSNYLPGLYRYYLTIDQKDDMIANPNHTLGNEYYIEDPTLVKWGVKILGIEKIDYNSWAGAADGATVDPYDPNSSSYYSSIVASRNNITLDAVLMGSEYTYNRTLTDFAFPWKRYHELRSSGVGTALVYLRNYAFMSTAEIVFKCSYPNLHCVPEEYKEHLMKLASLDVKQYLWHSLRYIEDIVTPSGNLQLRFDWSNAESEREEYLKELRLKSFPDRQFASYYHLV